MEKEKKENKLKKLWSNLFKKKTQENKEEIKEVELIEEVLEKYPSGAVKITITRNGTPQGHDIINKYHQKEIEEQYILEETVNNDENVIIVLPVLSDDDTLEISNNINQLNNTNSENNLQPTSNKCKEVTRKGKQCDYNAKPNSEYCGRHSK